MSKREWRPGCRWETCSQRILRRVVHESNLGGMTPGEVYDATVHAVMQERDTRPGDLREVLREMKRLESRLEWAWGKRGPQAAQIAARLDLESGVLRWAADEIRAMLTQGNQYGRKAGAKECRGWQE